MKQYTRLAVPLLIAVACTGGDERGATAPDFDPTSAPLAPLAPLAARPVASPSITVTALPSLGRASRAQAINDKGTIVGWSVDATGVPNAVKWTLDGTWTPTRLPGENGASAAHAINAAGDIVGVKGNRAVFWPATPAGGDPILLGCNTDLGPDAAVAINAPGTAAGFRDDVSLRRAVVWESSSACRQDLDPLAEGMSAEARGIDDAGNVSGYAYDAEGDQWAVRWTFQDGAWNIQTLVDGENAAANAINNAGDIAGSGCTGTTTPPCQTHALLWPVTGGRTDLGTLGGQTSVAFALNSAKELVGWTNTFPKPSTRGFIWSEATGMRGLGPLKRDNRTEAYGVNNAQADGSRQVVGFSARSGTQQAVVWRVP